MTSVIINDILPRTQAIAVGSQTVYSTDWTANYPTDVIVYSRAAGIMADDATQILDPSLYNVAFIGDSEIVQITLINPSTAGDIVTILRQTPADRENLYTNTNFTPSMLNNDFGILTMVDQQDQLIGAQVGVRYNYSEIINNPIDTILPILGPSQLWVKNASNTAIVATNINTESSGTINLGLAGQIAYYAVTGTQISGTNTLPPTLTGYLQAPLGFKDPSGHILLNNTFAASAVNYLQIGNAPTGASPAIAALGSDAIVVLSLISKGGGFSLSDSTNTDGAFLTFLNAAGTFATTIGVAAAQASSVNFNLPALDQAGFMISDGSGNLSLSGIPFDISSSITVNGWSAQTTKIFSSLVIGKMVFIQFTLQGTSNSNQFNITGLPHTTVSNQYYPILVTDNGINTFGLAIVSGTTITFDNNGGTGAASWTTSGAKAAFGSFWYQAS